MASKVIISTTDLRAIGFTTDVRSLVTSTDMKVEIFVDPDPKNRWLYDQFTFADGPALGFSKIADTDTFAFTDLPSSAYSKPVSDQFSFGDTPSVVMQFNRSFTDAFALDDFTAVDAVVKDMANAKTNVFGFGDVQAFGVGKGLADSFTFSDAFDSFGIGKGLTDTQSMTESLARTVQYSRIFTDTFVMDDAATVDALQKNTGALKQNIVSMGDLFGRTVIFNRLFTDSVTPTEDHAVSFSKPATDSFTVSEALSRSVTYNRAFSDSQGFGDAVDDYFIAKGLSDTQTMTEAHAASTSLGKTDNYSLADSPAQSFDKAATDSFSLSESLARTVTYNRTFTDAFSMDDAATVNALIKDHANAKTNIFSFADSQAFGFSKTASTDTFTFADAFDSVEVGKGLSDSVPMTENFSFALFSNAAMNAAQLNLSPFNE